MACFSTVAVFLAFVINRISVLFFTQCRCLLTFTPLTSSLMFGLAVATILAQHPDLYPCWMRKPSSKILFMYYLLFSSATIEVAYCLWDSLETFLYFTLPSKLEFNDCCTMYLDFVECPVLVGLVSNISTLTILLITLHVTKVCNFNLLICEDGLQLFIDDIVERRKYCFAKCPRGHSCPPQCPPACPSPSPRVTRSGKQYGC